MGTHSRQLAINSSCPRRKLTSKSHTTLLGKRFHHSIIIRLGLWRHAQNTPCQRGTTSAVGFRAVVHSHSNLHGPSKAEGTDRVTIATPTGGSTAPLIFRSFPLWSMHSGEEMGNFCRQTATNRQSFIRQISH